MASEVAEVRGADTLRGFLASPRRPGRFPALLLVHGALGLDDQMKEWTTRLGSEGYVALAVDLFGGRVPRTLDEGIAIYRTGSRTRREAAIDAAMRYLRSRPTVVMDRIGAVGWCAGGAIVFRLAVRDSTLRAVSVHYGAVSSAPATLDSVRAPVLGIFGGADRSIPSDSVHAFEAEMQKQAKYVRIVIYPGVGHAFEFPGASGPNSNGYHPAEAADAWRRTIEFFDERLKVPSERPPSNAIRRIGVLSSGFNSEVTLAQQSPRMDTLRAALERFGYRDGRDVVYINRTVTGGADSLSTAARDLVKEGVDVIVAGGSTEALLAERATSKIPIVFWSGEPIAEGLVTTLERPGRNATGIIAATNVEVQRLEMLNLVAPGSAPIGVLYNPTYLPGVGILQRARRVADSLGIRLQVIEVQSLQQIDSAFSRFSRDGVRAVLVNNHGLFRINAAYLSQLSLRYKLPMLSPYPEARDAGTLISSVPDFLFWSQRAAAYVDRVLRGANPATLPVEESVPQRFTINLKTAAALGITVPNDALRRAEPIR